MIENCCIQEGRRRALVENINATLVGWKEDIDKRLIKWEYMGAKK
jgi:hypothetical protein